MTLNQQSKTRVYHNFTQIIGIPTPLEKPITYQAFPVLEDKVFLAIASHHQHNSEKVD